MLYLASHTWWWDQLGHRRMWTLEISWYHRCSVPCRWFYVSELSAGNDHFMQMAAAKSGQKIPHNRSSSQNHGLSGLSCVFFSSVFPIWSFDTCIVFVLGVADVAVLKYLKDPRYVESLTMSYLSPREDVMQVAENVTSVPGLPPPSVPNHRCGKPWSFPNIFSDAVPWHALTVPEVWTPFGWCLHHELMKSPPPPFIEPPRPMIQSRSNRDCHWLWIIHHESPVIY